MAEPTKSYDARDVIVTWGEIRLDGAAPGSFVNLVYRQGSVEVTHGAQIQRQPGAGAVMKPLFLKHINGDTIAVGPEAMIEMEPGAQFGAEHETREWKFVIPHLRLFNGGSSR